LLNFVGDTQVESKRCQHLRVDAKLILKIVEFFYISRRICSQISFNHVGFLAQSERRSAHHRAKPPCRSHLPLSSQHHLKTDALTIQTVVLGSTELSLRGFKSRGKICSFISRAIIGKKRSPNAQRL